MPNYPKINKKVEYQPSTQFGGMYLFDIPNSVGKWIGQTGYRGTMDVWKHEVTGDEITINDFHDDDTGRVLNEVWVHDKKGNWESLYIGGYKPVLKEAHDFMKKNPDGWK